VVCPPGAEEISFPLFLVFHSPGVLFTFSLDSPTPSADDGFLGNLVGSDFHLTGFISGFCFSFYVYFFWIFFFFVLFFMGVGLGCDVGPAVFSIF